MSKKQRKIFWPALLAATVVLSVLGFTAGRARTKSGHASSPVPVRANVSIPGEGAPASSVATRNLSLQPEAFNLGRRLGRRFAANSREQSVLSGTLTIGSDQQDVRVARQQTNDGEEIEIAINGTRLTWKASEGAMSTSSRATGAERELIEQLVLDSPDQFVLAQLRGASYYMVARDVRPAEANDAYVGPLWNIVRVDDSDLDEQRRPESRWRLYYLNTTTGLIDKVVSEVRGETIEAEISGWAKLAGEEVPTQITWSSQGRTLMQYRLSTYTRQ